MLTLMPRFEVLIDIKLVTKEVTNELICRKKKSVRHSVVSSKFFPTIFSQKFRQSNVFTKELYCKLISWKFLKWGKINKITTLCEIGFRIFPHCALHHTSPKLWNFQFGNYGNSLLWHFFFDKNFVKVTLVLKKILKS